jgi:hypothetical protein
VQAVRKGLLRVLTPQEDVDSLEISLLEERPRRQAQEPTAPEMNHPLPAVSQGARRKVTLARCSENPSRPDQSAFRALALFSPQLAGNATLKSVFLTGNSEPPALAWRKERSDYRNLVLTISPRKKRDAETPQTPKRILATLMPPTGVRRPRMSRFGGTATRSRVLRAVDSRSGVP